MDKINYLKIAFWLRKHTILLAGLVSIPVYFLTNQHTGYHISAGLILAWSTEQLFVFSGIDKLKESDEE